MALRILAGQCQSNKAQHAKPEFPARDRIPISHGRNLLLSISKLAMSRGRPIVVIEFANCGTTCELLKREIGDYPNTQTFVKKGLSIFEEWSGIAEELKRFLDSHKVTRLIMVGANGSACMKCSIEQALNEGFKVTADPHGIADFNREKFEYPYEYDGTTFRKRLQVEPHYEVTYEGGKLKK
jgi:Isochorismatase family